MNLLKFFYRTSRYSRSSWRFAPDADVLPVERFHSDRIYPNCPNYLRLLAQPPTVARSRTTTAHRRQDTRGAQSARRSPSCRASAAYKIASTNIGEACVLAWRAVSESVASVLGGDVSVNNVAPSHGATPRYLDTNILLSIINANTPEQIYSISRHQCKVPKSIIYICNFYFYYFHFSLY